ncbi:tetratricopeptide repeat protein [Candidatus Nitrosacidococcus sp. I8]|uniref:tetratricopeptide repeat protein n=1 Tax=Candidatus Nitrosacidococcus sp. I8 TaxID=2942908 RepID=UPI002227FC42|nr:tetratricopeptide repeat protein [Candidatus Nitrosacidococcus sp. I8]CAH9019262.1 hypothetical protein NURINAE_01430 [Candidatus Nitrosacidococcus sp. I8]
MKKLIFISFLLSGSLFFSSTGWADINSDFRTATIAYNRKDYRIAFGLLNKLAHQGHAIAQYNLGVMYTNGQGVAQNDEQAAYWYQQAAEQGNTLAQFNLGNMYDNGQGVTQDYEQAVNWYQKAAKQGNTLAQYNLGVKYNNGQGVIQNYKQAAYWYQKAAEQGYALAQNNLGNMHDNGQGVAKNYEQAVYWYQKAAEQGNALAQYNLGLRYALGQGVIKNNVVAYALIKASAIRDDNVKKAQNIISQQMSQEERTAGQDLSKQISQSGNLLSAVNEYLQKHSYPLIYLK